jgi:hypothetical protein
MSEPTWPVADVDPIRRLRVLAAVVPGAVVVETRIGAAFEQVWAVAADLEQELPIYVPDVRSLRITRREGDRLEAHARGYAGLRARFDIVLRPGWCVMRSRFLLGGMAAVPDGDYTRFAVLSGVHIPAQRLAAPALAAFGRWASPGAIDRFTARVQLRKPHHPGPASPPPAP